MELGTLAKQIWHRHLYIYLTSFLCNEIQSKLTTKLLQISSKSMVLVVDFTFQLPPAGGIGTSAGAEPEPEADAGAGGAGGAAFALASATAIAC